MPNTSSPNIFTLRSDVIRAARKVAMSYKIDDIGWPVMEELADALNALDRKES